MSKVVSQGANSVQNYLEHTGIQKIHPDWLNTLRCYDTDHWLAHTDQMLRHRDARF